MANRRDGGLVIIGVEDKRLEPVGLNEDQLATWSDYDKLSEAVNLYARPSVSFDLERPFPFVYDSKSIVVIRVHEFGEIPILYSQDYGEPKKVPTLRKGACYVRSRHKPETSDIPSEEEMRELLELATDKGVNKFVVRAQKAGLFPAIPSNPVSTSDEERFRKQIEEMT